MSGTMGEWTFNTSIASPPASAQVRFDQTDFTKVTMVRAHRISAETIDMHRFLLMLNKENSLLVQEKDRADRYVMFNVTDKAVDRSDYVEIPVVVASAGAQFINARVLLADGVMEYNDGTTRLLEFVRASTKDTAWIDPYKVTLVVSLRPNISRVYLGSEVHYVDVQGTLEEITDEINEVRV